MDLIDIILSAIPDFFEDLWSSAEIVITAIPDYFPGGLEGIAFAVVAFTGIFALDHFLWEGKSK